MDDQTFDRRLFLKVGTKSVKECVQFYYLWKKVCADEYKRLRIVRRRRREQDALYNLRSAAAAQAPSGGGGGGDDGSAVAEPRGLCRVGGGEEDSVSPSSLSLQLDGNVRPVFSQSLIRGYVNIHA